MPGKHARQALVIQELQSWMHELAAAEPFETDVMREAGAEFLVRSARLLQNCPAAIQQFTGSVESLTWNFGYALSWCIWEDHYDLALRRQIVDGLPAFVAAACDRGETGGTFMLWENVVEFRDFPEEGISGEGVLQRAFAAISAEFRDRPRATAPELADVAYKALARQLEMTSECCQKSALHGLNHLEDPRTPALIRRLERSFASDEVRAYALTASLFMNP